MPHYFFHIREGASLTRDRKGLELPDAEAAREEAIATGRALMGERPILLHRTIEIADETGHVVDEISAHEILFHPGYSSPSQPAARNSPRR